MTQRDEYTAKDFHIVLTSAKMIYESNVIIGDFHITNADINISFSIALAAWGELGSLSALVRSIIILWSDRIYIYIFLKFCEKSNTLNSVGTISLGVSNPISISRPTKDMIDMKMAKSLISFLSYRSAHIQLHRTKEGQRQMCTVKVMTGDIRLSIRKW